MRQSINKYISLFLLMLLSAVNLPAQEAEPRELLLDLSYFMTKERIPYLKVRAREKVERQFIPQKNISTSIYIGEESESGLLGKLKTNIKGEANVVIPPSFKTVWDATETLTFIVVSESTEIFESATTELQITKARIEIDTLTEDEIRNVIVKVTELKNGEWLPAADVEVKLSVRRLLGNLPVNDEGTFTTDEEGIITAEFLRDSLPGDINGDLILIARTEDHETFGNIFTEKIVPWGTPFIQESGFFKKRTLWASQNRSPFWLLGLAYIIIGGVWGTLIYLILQLFKIRKLGRIEK